MGIREELTEQLSKILPIYIAEFGSFMSQEKIDFLQDDKNISNIIEFSAKSTGAWCSGNSILFSPDIGTLIKEILMTNSRYGIMPELELISHDKFIDNEKDYLDYIKYFMLKGGTELDYYLDVLPHEAMHLIGIGGGVLPEGITERRTRETCLKYGIRCAPILHSKENKLVGLMEKIVGRDILTRMGFDNSESKYDELKKELDNKCGKGTFDTIYGETEELYQNTYIDTIYPNVIDRFSAYRQMDFSSVFTLLEKSIEKNNIFR